MKAILILIFVFATLRLSAPPDDRIVILRGEPVNYDPMLFAFQKIESNFDTDTVNRLGYGGILQIGQEMVNEANRICKMKGIDTRFTLDDRLDSTKSVQMWYIVQNYWNPSYTLKKACHVWNPLASTKYYLKIKKVYES